jgi:hypothetical protein
MEKFSFKKGFSQVMQKDAVDVRAEIMTALNITTRSSWSARLNGNVEPKVSEAQEIERIFAKYGVTDVWGEA